MKLIGGNLAEQIVNGNEALALGALKAGVRVVTGYPGTPSTRALASLLAMNPENVHVEWSTNEKVAFEIATAASWAGLRALCTMKMSGLNVAYDSLISIAYSGIVGGLVVYVADDVGVNAGMAEQDSRGFAVMSDLPMLEPASVNETYQLIQKAFEISEEIGSPVFIRLVTAVANSKNIADIQPAEPPVVKPPVLIKDIQKFTKAGSAICLAQHQDLLNRLENARQLFDRMKLNPLRLSPTPGKVGVIVSGILRAYLGEAISYLEGFGLQKDDLSILEIVASNPLPLNQIQQLLNHSGNVVIFEELEPLIERETYIQAQRCQFKGNIIGKLNGLFSKVGAYELIHFIRGLAAACQIDLAEDTLRGIHSAELSAPRPITVCAGCPHRGSFMAINQAIRKLRLKRDEVMVTGDIGCTILGMNPPFNTVWNEVSMGASIALAQGFVHAGVKTPVIATMGDSTFFHAGISGLVNAIQHQVPLTLIIMDNGWTAMTGMQVNPGTDTNFQNGVGKSVDIAQIIPALGIEHFFIMDPYDLETSTATIQNALILPGVKVVLARRECAIPLQRREGRSGNITVNTDLCNLCKLCIMATGCPAISITNGKLEIDLDQCTRCGLCAEVCNFNAIQLEMPA